ncbi:MAG TPA: aldo/keto reductase, partial [Oceanipulchritudo sp.]|nr:aldo/keto reductase [Oceanipulchritudo sp.]
RHHDAKGLPTIVLGRTGVRVPRMALGTGSNFMRIASDAQAAQLLGAALDKGFYFWDTCSRYGSQPRIGQVLKTRRQEVFLASGSDARTVEAAKRSLEKTLSELQTDHLDLYQIDSVTDANDVRGWEATGLYAQMVKWKEEGVVRFIGISGRTSASAMKVAAERYDFDTLRTSLRTSAPNQDTSEQAIPAAAGRGMGVMISKVFQPQEKIVRLSGDDLIRYGLSLEHVHVAVVGIDSASVLAKNEQVLHRFKQMSPAELQGMHVALASFFRPGLTATFG